MIVSHGAVPDFLTASYTFMFSGVSDKLFFADTGATLDYGVPIIDNISIAGGSRADSRLPAAGCAWRPRGPAPSQDRLSVQVF